MKCYNCKKKLGFFWFLRIMMVSNRLCRKCDIEFFGEIKKNGNLESKGIYALDALGETENKDE